MRILMRRGVRRSRLRILTTEVGPACLDMDMVPVAGKKGCFRCCCAGSGFGNWNEDGRWMGAA